MINQNYYANDLLKNILNTNDVNTFCAMLTIEKNKGKTGKDSFLWQKINGIYSNDSDYFIHQLISLNKINFLKHIPSDAAMDSGSEFIAFCIRNAKTEQMIALTFPMVKSLLSEKPNLLFESSETEINPIKLSVKENNVIYLEKLLDNLIETFENNKLAQKSRDSAFTNTFSKTLVNNQLLDSLYDFAHQSHLPEKTLKKLMQFGAHLFSNDFNRKSRHLNSVNAFISALESEAQSSEGSPLVKNKRYWLNILSDLIILNIQSPLLTARFKSLRACVTPGIHVPMEKPKQYKNPALLDNLLFCLTTHKEILSYNEKLHREQFLNRTRRAMRNFSDFDETNRSNVVGMNAIIVLPLLAAAIFSLYMSHIYDTRRIDFMNDLDRYYPQCMESKNCGKGGGGGLRRDGGFTSSDDSSGNSTETPSAIPMQAPSCSNCGDSHCGEGTGWHDGYKELHDECDHNASLFLATILPGIFGMLFSLILMAFIVYRHFGTSLGFSAVKLPSRTFLSIAGDYTDIFPVEKKEELIAALRNLLSIALNFTAAGSAAHKAINESLTALQKPIDEIGYRILVDAIESAEKFITDYALCQSTLPANFCIEEATLERAFNLLPGSERLEQQVHIDVADGDIDDGRGVSMRLLGNK